MALATSALGISESEALEVTLHSQHPSGEFYFAAREVDGCVLVGTVPKDMLKKR